MYKTYKYIKTYLFEKMLNFLLKEFSVKEKKKGLDRTGAVHRKRQGIDHYLISQTETLRL